MFTQFNMIAEWLLAQVDSERGASLVEYALLVALIAVVCIGAVSILAGGAKQTFSSVGSNLSAAG